MYEQGTILELKEQRAPDKETKEPFAYNRVQVVGPSPVSYEGISEWSGVAARGVIITPLSNFGGVIEEPLGKIQAMYNVVEVPVKEMEIAPKVRIIDSSSAAAGPTPEEVFAEKAPGTAPEPGSRRTRTSPLGDDPRPKASDGPLGPVPSE